MNNRWRDIPFTYHLVNFTTSNFANTIPFVVGGATQQGTMHIFDNSNNQDSTSLYLSDNLIIGIVCDGCTSTHDEIRNSYSNNEIGSKLVSYNLSYIIQKYMSHNKILDDTFIESIEKELLARLKAVIDLQSDNEKEKEILIYDCLMTTILCFVITENDFIVFSCGDGIIGINGSIKSLVENGIYLSAALLPECCPSIYTSPIRTNGLVVNYKGNNNDLQNILLATDGFGDIVEKFQGKIKSFIYSSPPKSQGGYDFVLSEFRKTILKDEEIAEYSRTTNWPKDDASFLLLRRIHNVEGTRSSEFIIKGMEDDTSNSK